MVQYSKRKHSTFWSKQVRKNQIKFWNKYVFNQNEKIVFILKFYLQKLQKGKLKKKSINTGIKKMYY